MNKGNNKLKLYNELASWWPLLSPPDDYKEEASLYTSILCKAANNPIKTVIELGSGGGNNASHMKEHFNLTLIDLSEGMQAVSKKLNPECEHIQGDMRSIRLNRQFDAVFIHDAIMYMTTEQDLKQAIETAFIHCKPGGVALFTPDYIRETFKSYTEWDGHDGVDRALRFLEWCWDPDPNDGTYFVEFAYLLRYADGSVHMEYDQHEEGLFSEADWLRILTQVGFKPKAITVEYTSTNPNIGFLATRQ